MAALEILTVGHSTHPIERFLALLRGAGVEAIADVRRYPGSRRNPQFGAEALAGSLAEVGIGYEPFGEELGGRRSSKRRRSPTGRTGTRRTGTGSSRASPAVGAPGPPDNSAWRNASFRAYADYMSTPEFEAGLERLEALGAERRTAVMCAEAHPSRCHRQLIADALLARRRRVLHVLRDGDLAPHALNEHAVLDGDRVSYPGSPEQLAL